MAWKGEGKDGQTVKKEMSRHWNKPVSIEEGKLWEAVWSHPQHLVGWVISPSQSSYCSCSLHRVWAVAGKYCVTWFAQMTREQLALCFIAPVKIILMFWHSREHFDTTVVYWGKHLGLSLYHNLLVYLLYCCVLLKSFFFFFSSVFWNSPNFWRSKSIFSCCCYAHTKRSFSPAH